MEDFLKCLIYLVHFWASTSSSLFPGFTSFHNFDFMSEVYSGDGIWWLLHQLTLWSLKKFLADKKRVVVLHKSMSIMANILLTTCNHITNLVNMSNQLTVVTAPESPAKGYSAVQNHPKGEKMDFRIWSWYTIVSLFSCFCSSIISYTSWVIFENLPLPGLLAIIAYLLRKLPPRTHSNTVW